VSPRRTRTADYGEADRVRLAEAVVAARTAIGWNSTMDLVRAVGRSQRAIYALEAAEPTVGQSILQAVGATLGAHLADWDANTPRGILNGNPAPPIERRATSSEPPPDEYEEDIWSDESMIVFEALEAIARSRGRELDDATIAEMRASAERKRRNRPAETVVTPHDGSHEDSE
jgi:hypothetical protein